MAERGPFVLVTVDGPAAAGKRTLARRLAAHLGLRYLDSGELYRAVAWRVLDAGADPANAEQAAAAARALGESDLAAAGLRDEAVGRAASVVAAIPEVRAALLGYQRAFGRVPPGAVIDGRDIGTVVFPDARHKLFVTATLEVRAERRYRELRERGVVCDRDDVRREMAARDTRDRQREIAPLAAAEDAYVLDTTDLDADAAFEAALARVASQGADSDAEMAAAGAGGASPPAAEDKHR